MTNTKLTATVLRAIAADARIFGDLKLEAACQAIFMGAKGLRAHRGITLAQADAVLTEAHNVVEAHLAAQGR